MRPSILIPLLALLAPGAALAAQPGYIGFVTAGESDPSILPAVNAVPRATVNNIAIAFPTNVLVHGQRYLYQVWSHVFNVTGTCITSYSLSQTVGGKKTVLDSHEIYKYKCKPGDDWIYVYTGKPVPNKPGPAVLTGIVKFGTKAVSFNVPVLIQ